MKQWQTKIGLLFNGLTSGIFNRGEIRDMAINLRRKWAPLSGEIYITETLSDSVETANLFGKYRETFFPVIGTPELTHPISGERLILRLPEPDRSEERFMEVLESIMKDSACSEKTVFYSLYELFKERLTVEENELGAVWKKIPCDMLMPDHSLWHQNALVSALHACGNDPHLLFFSIGSGNFTAPSLTLREFWAGSLIRSYLIWSGMRTLCDEFGPDHILYPAVSGNPLFHHWLCEQGIPEFPREVDPDTMGIPSFSNSFVALLPQNSLEAMIGKIECSIRSDWRAISTSVYEEINKLRIKGKGIPRDLWDREIDRCWVFRNGTSPWIKSFDDPLVSDAALETSGFREIAGLFKEISGNPSIPGFLYLASHELSQKRHRMHKLSLKSEKREAPENRCPLCEKNSISYLMDDPELTGELMKSIKEMTDSGLQDSEKPCPICITRRLAHLHPQSMPSPLKEIFQKAGYSGFFASQKSDKYFAIISMDGDNMGNLVKGKNEKFARWRDIMHSAVPAVIAGLHKENPAGPWESLEKILDQKRCIFPSVHQFLSESLADFSLSTVPFVIKKYHGRLLYAGGDDVVAALPVQAALPAAREIRDFYRTAFARMNSDGSIEPCSAEYKPGKGERLLTHLGKAVTMSAAVVFAKQDEHAGGLLSLARKILDDEAKDNRGRDAIAVALKDGGSIKAMVSGKWEFHDGSRFTDALLEGAGDAVEKNDKNTMSGFNIIVSFLREQADRGLK